MTASAPNENSELGDRARAGRLAQLAHDHFPLERFGTCSCGEHIKHLRGGGTFYYGEWEKSWAEHFADVALRSYAERPALDYGLSLPSGPAPVLFGSKAATREANGLIWAVEPGVEEGCTGQTWRNRCERSERARSDCERERGVMSQKLLALGGSQRPERRALTLQDIRDANEAWAISDECTIAEANYKALPESASEEQHEAMSVAWNDAFDGFRVRFLNTRLGISQQEEETTMNIMVNGKALAVSGADLSYEDVLRLAGQTPGATVVYHGQRHGDHQRSGIMHKGGPSVAPEEGMHFDAVHTGSA